MKPFIRWLAGFFGLVVIDYRTAEYLGCLSGQIPWGNQKRRAAACADLGEAHSAFYIRHRPQSKSLECFQEATWEITTKKR